MYQVRDMQKSLQELTALYDLTAQLGQSTDMRRIFSILANNFSHVCPYHELSVHLYDKTTNSIIFSRSRRKRNIDIGDINVPEDILVWVLENRKIRIIPLASFTTVSEDMYLVLLPLISGGEIIGLIQLALSMNNAQITPHLQQIFCIVATHAAAAFHNALLFEKVSKRNNELVALKNKFSVVIENMIHGMLVLDKKERIQLINRKTEILFDVSPLDCVGQRVSQVFHRKNAKAINSVLQVLKKGSQAIEREVKCIHPKNGAMVLLISASVLEEENGTAGYIFILKEVACSTKLIAQAESDRMKSQFLSTVSHELKTPLNLILGSTNILLEGLVGSVNDKQHRLLNLIKDGTDRLSFLVKDLLDMARIEAEKGHMNLQAVSLDKIIESVCKNLHAMIVEKKVSIEKNYSGMNCEIVGDRDSLFYLIHNLLHNAIKFNHAGGYVKISISPWSKDSAASFVELTVADSGIGIDDKDKRLVFDEFHRAYIPDGNNQGGNGLGLSIAKKVVDMHKGKIVLKSEKNHGTVVKIILPRDLRTE